jgi:hypothetical protein
MRSTLRALICEKNYKNKALRPFAVAYWSIQAGGAAGAGARGWATRIF